MDKRFGHYTFTIGVLVALLLGLASSVGLQEQTSKSLLSLLVLMGFVVGAFNITGKETNEFMLSAGVLCLFSSIAIGFRLFNNVAYIGGLMTDLLAAITLFAMPALFVVAVKNIWRLAKSR